MRNSRITQSALCVALVMAGSAAPAFAEPVSQDPFVRLVLEVCPKVVKNGPAEIAAYVADFNGLVVEPPVNSGPENKVESSFASLLSVSPGTPIVHVANRDPKKRRTSPFLSVAGGSNHCLVEKGDADASFAELSRHLASEPGWSNVVDKPGGEGVWVHYDENDNPQFTLNLFFVPNYGGRTLFVSTLPLTPEQRLEVALDDRPRIVATVLNECIAAVAERRAPRRKAVSEFFEAPPERPLSDALHEKHDRTAVLQLEPKSGESCLYTSNGGTLANRRLAELIKIDLEKRGAVPAPTSASRGEVWWRLQSEGKAEIRITLTLDPTAQLLTMWIGGASTPPPPPAPPPPPPAPPPR